MNPQFEILIDEIEPGGIAEQVAFVVDETGGKVTNFALFPSGEEPMYLIMTAEWPKEKIIDSNLVYGFVPPLNTILNIRGVMSWKQKTSDTAQT